MPITLESGTPTLLNEVVETVALWQIEGAPVQLHPGDLGWAWRFGAQALADQVRVWRRDGQILAAGMRDGGDGLIRMAIAPAVDDDEVFAVQLLTDLSDPEKAVLPAGRGRSRPDSVPRSEISCTATAGSPTNRGLRYVMT